jgi:hypothetical protein
MAFGVENRRYSVELFAEVVISNLNDSRPGYIHSVTTHPPLHMCEGLNQAKVL